MYWAARKGHAELVELMVADPRINVNIMDSQDETPLHRAAEEGHEDVVRLLLATEGIDVDIADNESIPVSVLI